MNKLTLNLNSLQVQSFPVTGVWNKQLPGSIHAHGCQTGNRCSKVKLYPSEQCGTDEDCS